MTLLFSSCFILKANKEIIHLSNSWGMNSQHERPEITDVFYSPVEQWQESQNSPSYLFTVNTKGFFFHTKGLIFYNQLVGQSFFLKV